MACAAVSLAIAGYALLSESGWTRMRDRQAEQAHLEQRIERLQKRNLDLADRAKALKDDDVVLEEVAREELGYIKEDEVILLLDQAR